MGRRRDIFLILLGVILIGGFLAIQLGILSTGIPSEPQDLAFETIQQNISLSDGGDDYQGEKANLLVIADPEDVQEPGLDIRLSTDLTAQLDALDYDHHFAILVLQGITDTIVSGNIVTVTQVQREGNQVIMHARFPGSRFGHRVMEGPCSPYHLVAVEKNGAWRKTIRFVLMDGDEVVAETRHYVP